MRYFNVFGPRQALDDQYATVIPKFIDSILSDEQPHIFGTGKQSRDFIYIDNVVEANILAVTAPNIKHEVFNVANGREHTILELLDFLNKIIGNDLKPVSLAPRPGDVLRTCADISRIKEVLGYKPKVDFEQGLRQTVAGFAEY